MEARQTVDIRGDWIRRGEAFQKGVDWARPWTVKHPNEFWAPDVSFHAGQYWLYYSVPRDGEQCRPKACTHSAAIGFATSQTGKADDWKDHGAAIIFSNEESTYNAIDPNLFVEGGSWYLTFGSFWSGIQQVELDPGTGKLKAGAKRINIASRPLEKSSTRAIEAPFLYKKGKYYYLFVSFDKCCAGVDSTYSIHVGRGTAPYGPFYDDRNVNMLDGGGKMVLDKDPVGKQFGPGGQSVFWDTKWKADILVYHYYDGNDHGASKLGIKKLNWVNGWPVPVDLPAKKRRNLQEAKKPKKGGKGRKTHTGGKHH